MDFQPKAQTSTPSSARGRRGRASLGTEDERLGSELQGRKRNKWYEIMTFLPVSASRQLFPLLNPKLQKKRQVGFS